MSSEVAHDPTRKYARVRVGWKALVHVNDLKRKPWVKGAIERIELSYQHTKARAVKAQAWWVFPDPEICTHYDEPQIVVTIMSSGPMTTMCYECGGKDEKEIQVSPEARKSPEESRSA